MKKILFLLFFIPLMGISQAKFGGNSVAAARASLKNSNTYTLTYVDGIFYLVSTTTSYPIAFSTVGSTGTGNLVYATSPTLVTPNLGTPSAVTLTNGTGLPVSTGISGLGSGIATFLGTPSSANLLAALTTKTGTGNAVFSDNSTLTGTTNIATIANTLGANFATSSGFVGVGITLVANRKIVLFEATNNDHQYYGFGVNAATLRYQVASTANNHVFFAATGTSASQQLFSINGNQTVTYISLTTTQINALTGMTAGTLAYNSTLSMFVFYNGSAWKRMDGTTNM